MTKSVFASTKSKLFTNYTCTIKMRGKLLGGIPKDPKVIEGWLRAKAGISDEYELKQAMMRTLLESGHDVKPDMSYDELIDAVDKVASIKQTSGFKINGHGLYIEGRQVKALVKECVNILYPYPKFKWGGQEDNKGGKSPKNMTAETVFIGEDDISMDRKDPDGIEFMMVHTGRTNSLAYHEFTQEAELTFTVQVARDHIAQTKWAEIWTLGEENGLGAVRSQGFGKFDVIAWEKKK